MTSDGGSHKKFLIDNILRPEFGKRSVVTNSTNTNTTRKKIPDSEKILTNETLPSWIYCTRYSDRPSCSGRRGGSRRRKLGRKVKIKRPRTSFNRDQLATLEKEFADNPYLTEARRQNLAQSLDLQESQIKIWFQNKRAKRKKDHNKKNAATIMSTEEAVISSSEAAAGKTAAAAALLMTQK